jgi:hypothetical protein
MNTRPLEMRLPHSYLHGCPYMSDDSSSAPRSYLTFALLDSLTASPTTEYESVIKGATVRRIGPLVEFAYLDYPNATTRLVSPNHCVPIASLQSALSKSGLSNFQIETTLNAKDFEFIRGFQAEAETEDLRWMTFCKRLENAASSAGLGDSFAKALTGTVEEMSSNIVDHSEHAETGIVGYRWSPSEFEYVVADSGIGVLKSLRKNSYYSGLTDSAHALETAIQEGESSHGHNVGHGLGFRDLLNNIATRNSYLRFRSGNHNLVIDGTRTPAIWKTERGPTLQGLVISVVSKKLAE